VEFIRHSAQLVVKFYLKGIRYIVDHCRYAWECAGKAPMNRTATAVLICIVVLYGVDYVLFSGAYFDILRRMVSDISLHIG